jgi:hypothetical protein
VTRMKIDICDMYKFCNMLPFDFCIFSCKIFYFNSFNVPKVASNRSTTNDRYGAKVVNNRSTINDCLGAVAAVSETQDDFRIVLNAHTLIILFYASTMSNFSFS